MAIDVNMDEVLISPLSSMVREISAGVAAAQRQLDAAALATQAQLATEHPELQALGYQVTWYQIPEAQVEMRMALHFEKTKTSSILRGRAQIARRILPAPIVGHVLPEGERRAIVMMLSINLISFS